MTDTVELTALVVVTVAAAATTGVGVGAFAAGTASTVGGSGAVSESTIAVIGELENALFDDCDESSSLSVSDSEDFSLSSSAGSSTGSSLLAVAVSSDVEAFFELDFSGASLLALAALALEAVTPSVLAVVVLSEAGDAGDFNSLKPLSSERIFVLLELRLLLEEVDEELEEAVEDELWLLLVLVGHFLIGTESESSESSLVLSSVAIERDEMSVLLEVRRRDEEG